MAADWANAYVAAANEVARRRAIEEATHMLKFLHEELGKTSVLGVQQGIYQLVETQINTIALANVRQEYAFRVVDPATAPDPDRPVRPIRPLIVALGAALGFGAMLLVLLLRTGPGRPEERPDGA
jgi:LPS O-antigen subunit length determinant protein (WzzB/FepE family)